MFRHQYSSRSFIIPVVLYSLFYNLPKFFELTTSCPSLFQNNSSKEMKHSFFYHQPYIQKILKELAFFGSFLQRMNH